MAEKEKPLAFSFGQVSKFSVSELETPEEPATPSFSGAAVEGTRYNDFYIHFSDKDNKLKALKLNPCGMASPDWTIAPDTYYFDNSYGFYTAGYSTYGNTDLYGGKVEISVVNGQYHFEFINLADQQGNVVLAYATYTGEIAGLNVPDLRTPLAKPTNVTATAEANTITIKWDAVEGADGYRVKLYSPYDESFEDVVYVTEYVYKAKLYSTKYSFTIMSYASDENENKSSDDAYVDVTTGKDPNALADVILSEPTADTYSSYGFCFRMNITDNSGKYFRFFFNEADRGNNSLNTGVYTGIGNGSSDNYAPGVGKFAATMFDKWGSRVSGFYARHFKEASTIEVTFANNEYTIVLTHEGKTYGYKGMPEGWEAPSAGGDDNTGEGGGDNTGGEDQEQPDVTDEDFTNWNYGAVINQGSGIVTLTDRSGTGRVVEFKLNEIAIAKFYGDTSKSSHFTDVKVDGVSATATAESWFQFGSSGWNYFVEIDMTINGVHYTGKAAALEF